MLLLLTYLGEINTVASVDVDGDGNYEAFVGTSTGLYLFEDGPSSSPRKVDGISVPVLHISYYDDGRLLLTLDDMFTPLVLMSSDTREFKSLKVTGKYSKAFALNGRIYVLSESGLFVLDGDSLAMVLDGARDVTVCGAGGHRRVFSTSDNLTLVVGADGVDTLNLGSSFVICGDTAVYTEFGAITFKGRRPVITFKNFAYEPHTTVDGISLKVRNGMLSVNGVIRGESRVASFYAYEGRLYLLYGRANVNFLPLYKPFVRASFPFTMKMGIREVNVLDLNLMNSVSVGIMPVSPGEYAVKVGEKTVNLQINRPGEYDLSSHLSGTSPVSLSYTSDGVEIYINLQQPAYVDVTIVNFTGKVVKHLFSGYRRGSFKLTWEGTLNGGRVARRGVYFVQVKINGRTYNKRFVWLR